MELRDYQIYIAKQASELLKSKGLVYLSMEVRTGKSLTALEVCRLCNFKKLLFLTKKKAISSIESDFNKFGYKQYFEIEVINDESMHKSVIIPDVVIHDEHHRFGAFPKPSQGAKLFREKYSNLPMIFLSGTPTPESYSQIFHQMWVSKYNPFAAYKNFYQWAKTFVTVKDRHLGYAVVKDYSHANEQMIKPIIEPYMISFTQKQAGFTSNVNEIILTCPIKDKTRNLIKMLQRDRVIEGKEEVIIADTGAKMMQKVHQMFSGTVIFESGNYKIIDDSKALFIRDYFKGKKIGIFYKFKAEFHALKLVFDHLLTDDLSDFDNSQKNIALQIVSGREGISLKNAEALVFYNIDFSATSYFQAKDRLTTMDRLNNNVYWVFAENGIEHKIYKAVQQKKDYTLKYYKNDYGKISR